MNHFHSEMAPPAPGKQSPVPVGVVLAPGCLQQQQASMINNRCAAVVMDSDDNYSSAAELCNQYRQILRQHVSLQTMMSANHIHDDEEDHYGDDGIKSSDDISLGSSCCILHYDGGVDEGGDELDGTMSRCDSLNGSFLSGMDSVQIIRRRKISDHEQKHQEQEDDKTTTSVSVSSVLEGLDDLFDVDNTNSARKDVHGETTDCQASCSSSSSLYSFDLDFMTSKQS